MSPALRVFALTACAASLIGCQSADRAPNRPPRIALVDLGRLNERVDALKALMDRIDAEKRAKAKGPGLLPGKEKEAAVEEWNRFVAKKLDAAIAEWRKAVARAIEEYAKSNDIDLVIQKGGVWDNPITGDDVLFSDPTMDITDAIAEILNDDYGESK